MAVTQTQLTGLYLAYFGRPPDTGGLAFYLSQPNATLISVAADFSGSAESQALYGKTFGAAEVDAIYMNLFNRHAEQAGVDYWTGQVNSGAVSPAYAAYAIMLGAQNADKTAVANKLQISTLFLAHLDTATEIAGYAGGAAAETAREFLALVDSTTASVTSATANVDGAILAVLGAHTAGGQTFALTAAPGYVSEGSSITFVLTTVGVAPGTSYTYNIIGVDSTDLGSGGTLTGTATVGADGKALITIPVAADQSTEGTEFMTLSVAGQKATVTVNDTSTSLAVVVIDQYTVNFTVNGNNNVYKNGVTTGSPDFSSTLSTDSLTVGGTTTLGNVLGFTNVTLGTGAVLTMAPAVYTGLTAATSFSATGTQSITLTGALTAATVLNSAIENFTLANVANDVTLGTGAQNITGGTGADIVRTGTQTAITGTIALSTGTDQLVITTTGTDISAATLTSVDQINLNTDVSATMTLAEALLLNTATGTNTVTLTSAGTFSANSQVESYVLAGTGANDITLTLAAQNVTGQAAVNDIVRTGALGSVTGTIVLGTGGTDQLVISTTGTNISTATLTSVEQINLDNNVNATLNISENALVNTGTGNNTITLSNGGTTTGAAQVEAYVLANASGNDFTLGRADQGVSVAGGTNNDIVRTGTQTSVTGSIDLGGGGADQLVITTTGTNISTATIANVEQINLDTGVSATMTGAYNALVNTAAGTNTITLTDAGVATGNANVESYILANGAGNDFTLGASGQNVSITAGTNNDIVRTGTLTSVTGTINLGGGATDKLVITNNGSSADISTATLTSVEQISLDNGASAKMTIAEHLTVLDTAAGTNTITLSDAGVVSGLSTVENYVLGNGTNTFTLGTTAQNVTGGTGDDTVKGSGTLTGTYSLGAQSVADTLELTGASNITGATLTSVERIVLDNNVNVTMTAAQAALLYTAAGTNTVTLTTAGTFTGAADVETYVLADLAGNVFTLGAVGQNVTGSATFDDVISTGALTSITGNINVGGATADILQVGNSGTTTDITGATLTGFEEIDLATDASVTMTLAQHGTLVNAAGTNTVNLTTSGTFSANSQVENYVLSSAANNDITLTASGQSVTGGTKNDIVRTGTLTSVTGTFDLAGGTDQFIVSTTGTDISKATLLNVEQLNLDNNVSATVTIAQSLMITNATGSNTLTLADAGTIVGDNKIEAYVLANGTNDFTLALAGQNVTGGTGDDTVHTGAITAVTATIALDGGNDTLELTTNNTSISGATITGVDQIILDNNVSATMTIAQSLLVTAAAGTNKITLTDAGTTTGSANVETYQLANLAGNDFTLGFADQNVTGQGQADILRTGSLTTLTGALNLAGGSDTLVVTAGTTVDITGATLTGIENLTLDTNSSIKLTKNEYTAFSGTINGIGTNTVTFTDAVAITGDSSIENYVLASTAANTFTIGALGQSVSVSGAGVFADKLQLSGTVTGTYDLGAGTDTLKLTGTGNIAGATLSNIETLDMGNFAATMTAAQYNGFSTFANGTTVTISTTGTITADTNINGYVLAGSGNDSITFAGNGAALKGWTNGLSLSGGGTDTVTVNLTTYQAASDGNLGGTASTITNFTAGSGTGFDIILPQLAGVNFNGSYVQASSATNLSGMANHSVIEIAASGVVDLTKIADNAAVETAIFNAIAQYPAGNVTAGDYVAIVYSDTTVTADAGIYVMHVTGNTADLAKADFSIERIATIAGVGADALTAANFGL